MTRNQFPRTGIIAAVVTPTNGNGRLRRHALAGNLAWLRAQGIHGVQALGSTGEFPRFTIDERKSILTDIVAAAGSLPVIANISDIRPAAAIELGRHARSLGLQAVALMAPNFFPLSAADQRDFFLRVADRVHLPVLLYNFPELAGNRIAIETISAFADQAPLLGVKQSGGEFSYHKPLIALAKKKGFVVFSGADTRLSEAMVLGVAGCIGGLVNFVPDVMLEIFAARMGGARADCGRAAAKMAEIGTLLDQLTFPLNMAAGMEARGLDPGLPKAVVSSESAQAYRRLVAQLRQRFHQWKLELVGAR